MSKITICLMCYLASLFATLLTFYIYSYWSLNHTSKFMSAKGSFENHYDQYTHEIAGSILDESRHGLSEKFESKLHHFKQSKLGLLNSELHNEIFYDGTVYTGSAGLALYYFLCSLKEENSTDFLKKALEYINIDNLKGKRISFLCGDAGPLAIATVISYKLGVKRPNGLPEYKAVALRLMSLISVMNESPDELLYGRAGYLYALLFVNKYVNGKEVIPANHIEKVINCILKSGKQLATKLKTECPLIWEWHDKVYLGAAHGMAGILFMLLQARLYVNIIEIRSFIKPTIDWLLRQQFQSGNFPSSLGSVSGDRLVQWCHGAPGFVPLCILASQVFEDDKYMKIALQLGDVVWERGLCTKGYSICHGVSGNGYAFLQLYQATKKPMHLYRACCFMEWCAVERPGTELRRPDRPASLFEGVVGRLYLAHDLAHPTDAKFPAFEL